MVDQYIDQILVTDVDQEPSDHGDFTVPTHNTASAGRGEHGLDGSLPSEDSTLVDLGQMDENWFAQQTWDDEQNWDNVSMQFLDSFAVDYGARIM